MGLEWLSTLPEGKKADLDHEEDASQAQDAFDIVLGMVRDIRIVVLGRDDAHAGPNHNWMGFEMWVIVCALAMTDCLETHRRME